MHRLALLALPIAVVADIFYGLADAIVWISRRPL